MNRAIRLSDNNIGESLCCGDREQSCVSRLGASRHQGVSEDDEARVPGRSLDQPVIIYLTHGVAAVRSK